MNRKRIIILSLVIVAAGIGGTVYLRIKGEPKEPVYQGLTLTQWLTEDKNTTLIHYGDYHLRSGASAAVQAIGTNAIPTLLKMYRAKNPAQAVHMIRSLLDPKYMIADVQHDMAFRGFEILGTNALPAAPAIADLMRTGTDTHIRLAALETLKNIHAWNILLPALIEMFKHDPDAHLRENAADEIVSIFPEESEKSGVFATFPEMRKYLNNQSTNQQPAESQ